VQKGAMALTYNAIGLLGGSVGTAHLKADKIEWRDRSNQAGGEFAKDSIKKIMWQMVGAKGYLKVYMADGTMTSMDGFSQTDYEKIKEFVSTKYGIELSREQVCAMAWMCVEFFLAINSLASAIHTLAFWD
jgi:propanediol dehydratase large subunit